jgi:lysophospholipase L1-like esterase
MSLRSKLLRLGFGLSLTLVVLMIAEGALRVVRGPVPPPPLVRQMWDPGKLPFSEKAGKVEPVFQERDAAGDFPAAPRKGRKRVMVFGESSVRGGSYLPVAQEFPALLEGLLTAAGMGAEVLNLGRVGMDSHSIRVLIPAATAYKPEVAVIYHGHNDIGNAYFLARYSSVSSATTAHARAFFQRFQVYAALRDLVMPAQTSPGDGPPVQTIPTASQGALAVAEFASNLEIEVRTLQDAGASVILVTPMSRDGVYEANDASCRGVIPAWAWSQGNSGWMLLPQALSADIAEAALAASPECPEALFLRGWWKQQNGDLDGGWEDLRAARERDPRPVRANAGIVAAVRAVAARTGATLVDPVALNQAGKASATDPWFIDHVHLSTTGHVRLAAMIEPALEAALAARK